MNYLLYLITAENKDNLRFRFCQYPHKEDRVEVELINHMYDAKVHKINEISECDFRFAILYCDFIKEVVVSEERKCQIEEMSEDEYEELKKSLTENCPKKELCGRCSIDKGDCWLLHGWKKEGAVYKHSYPLLGEYLPDSKTVVLYVNNIDDSCGKPTCNGVLPIYIHELFHTYYHYVTEQKQAKYNYIREIEEAMTEFSTLVFIRYMKNECSGDWYDIFNWALESIGKKQNKVGNLPAYGFGRFLFDNIPESEAFDWINKFAERLGYIDENDELVRQYKQMVYPFYPTEPEKCMELLRKILFETNNKPVKTSRCKGNRSRIMCKSAVKNPWTGISWKNTIALCDETYFTSKYGSPASFVAKYSKAGMTFNCLPEPFSGDINSKVYCLNMNPGAPDPDFYKDKKFESLTQRNLIHKQTGVFWTAAVTNSSGKIHDGVFWFQAKTKSLKAVLMRDPNLFFVDYFPYHSDSGFNFPKSLPSYEYRNNLIEQALRDGKIIIIMRQRRRWEDAVPALKGYDKIITLKSPAGGWLSDNNFKYGAGVNYADLLKAL